MFASLVGRLDGWKSCVGERVAFEWARGLVVCWYECLGWFTSCAVIVLGDQGAWLEVAKCVPGFMWVLTMSAVGERDRKRENDRKKPAWQT